MTALIIIAAFLALAFYSCFVVIIAFWLAEVADTFWYDSGQWVFVVVGVTLTVAPIAILVEVVT